jgi:glucokinase
MPEPSQAQLAIGVDVGGTKCAAGLVTLVDGRVLARRLQRTAPQRGGEAVLAEVCDMIRGLRAEEPSGAGATAVGVCVAELVSRDGHVVSDATIRWRDIQVADRIGMSVELPVSLDADVRAAARAEGRFGAGRNFESFVFVTVGTGISACLVIDGTPYAGARGLTGTFASSRGMIPNHDGELVPGPPLEQFAAGPAIAARFAALRADFNGDARDVLALAEVGDDLARTVVSSAAQALGAAVAQLVNVCDPEAVVIGGGLGLAEGLYRRALDQALREHVWADMHREILLLSAELGTDAGIVGAALSAVANQQLEAVPKP